jgi:ribonuclease P protein component
VSYQATIFPKSLRLTEASDYRKVFDSAHRSADKEFLVLATENSLEKPRLGLAISKKHLRLAVQRNRVKRLVRESFRLHQSELAGFDFVVLAQRKIKKKNNIELRSSIEKHWKKILECAKS